MPFILCSVVKSTARAGPTQSTFSKAPGSLQRVIDFIHAPDIGIDQNRRVVTTFDDAEIGRAVVPMTANTDSLADV